MATVHPFRALRPRREFVREIVGTVPAEVVSVDKARKIVAMHPHSFLRVIKPEIDLDNGSEANLYQQGAANFCNLVKSDRYTWEPDPSLYIYKLETEKGSMAGVFGCVAVGEYEDGTIVRHEKTRPAKARVRMRHVLAQRAHSEPVMLGYRADDMVDRIVDRFQSSTDPLYDFEDEDGIRHIVWKVADAASLVEAFGRIPRLYVADGHHRCKAASQAAASASEREDVSSEVEFFPAVLFPLGQMRLQAYNRVVYHLPMASSEFLSALEGISVLDRNIEQSEPGEKGHVCIYLDGNWHRFKLPAATRSAITADLDVAKLSDHILRPLLNITDSRTDKNIGFISGSRGTQVLTQMVDEGAADVAFSLYPTSLEELVNIADAGELMPPKSTWFEPKLKSGLLVHSFARETNSPVRASDITRERT